MSCYKLEPPVSGWGEAEAREGAYLDSARQPTVCASRQNIQRREEVMVSKPTWISNASAPIYRTFLTLRGQGSPSRNLVRKQRLEIAGFDPSRRQ